jgi:hypothetical protein
MAEKSVKEWVGSLCEEALASPLLDNFIEMSRTLFSSKLRQNMRNYGIALGTLHLMQPYLDAKAGTVDIAGMDVPIGEISNLKEGDLSISFKNEGNYDSKVSLTKTKWGESLWELISSNAIFMGVATGAG